MVCQEWLDFAQTKLARKKIRTALKEIGEEKEHGKMAVIEIESYNRSYLLSDIITVLQQNNLQLHRADCKDDPAHDRAETRIWLEAYSMFQLDYLQKELEKIRSVISVEKKWVV